jgi:hypothetical protein
MRPISRAAPASSDFRDGVYVEQSLDRGLKRTLALLGLAGRVPDETGGVAGPGFASSEGDNL